MKQIDLIVIRMVVAKDIQEKMGFKEEVKSYELKADFDKIHEEVKKEMSKKELIICYNKIISGEE